MGHAHWVGELSASGMSLDENSGTGRDVYLIFFPRRRLNAKSVLSVPSFLQFSGRMDLL